MENRYALQPKTQVKNYWVHRLLEEDECGFVYLAEDMNTNKEVSLYELFPQDLVKRGLDNSVILKADENEKEFKWRSDSFLSDIKKLIPFKHRSSLKVIRSFDENGTFYGVSEYLQAQTLKEYLESKHEKLKEKEIHQIISPLTELLYEMERQNIVHKNINLKTILLDKKRNIYLGSFGMGICNRLRNQDACAFIPIEQCLMEKRLASTSDVYALGAVLYTLVTGQKPVDAKIRQEELKRGNTDPLKTLKPSAEYSEALCITINSALQLNSAQRAKSVTQFNGKYKKELSKVDPEALAKIEKNKRSVSVLPKSMIRVSAALFIGVIALYIIVEKEKPKGSPDLFEAIERSLDAHELTSSGEFKRKSSRENARIGYAYAVGEGFEKNEKKAYDWNLKAAEEGDRYAMYNIGLAYLHGKGTKKDYTQAIKWFELANEKGVVGSSSQLAYCFSKGLGVSADLKKAIEYYKRDIDQGYKEAYAGLGWVYEKNENYLEALKMYQQVGGKSQGWAEMRIAGMYEKGKGVSKNHFDAVNWYKKAASHGSAYAMNKMGWFYEKGKGSLSQNFSNAAYWYEQAAETGYAMGQTNLGYMYERGLGVTKNTAIAVEWYQSAARKGNAYAQKRLKKLGKTW